MTANAASMLLWLRYGGGLFEKLCWNNGRGSHLLMGTAQTVTKAFPNVGAAIVVENQ